MLCWVVLFVSVSVCVCVCVHDGDDDDSIFPVWLLVMPFEGGGGMLGSHIAGSMIFELLCGECFSRDCFSS